MALMRLPLLGCPHRASPPCPTATDNPLPQFSNLKDRLLTLRVQPPLD
jgi:hypothetical protein